MSRHGKARSQKRTVGRLVRNPGIYCECGNPKAWYSQTCRRCYQLDGSDSRTFDVLMLLRACDTVTIEQAVMETGYSRNDVHTAMTSLIRRGRVRNLCPPSEAPIGTPGEYMLVR